ncbi:MAG: CRISPR system precrRNA processing endoribonuclease RAMP protein Cas6 [Desulfuromonadales bacterium]|nr:CRISPR system precrRNA processing endoribonuclease RAMP protein Cas6 [Desulfuromonadales bacterium]
MDFIVVNLAITVRKKGISLPFQLFKPIRENFKLAFQEAIGCIDDNGHCLNGDNCLCKKSFGQLLSSNREAVRRYQKPPLPFVFDIPVLDKPNPPEIELGLVLVGTAMNDLTTYIAALQRLFDGSRRGLSGFELVSIESKSGMGDRKLLFKSDGFIDLSLLSLISAEDIKDAFKITRDISFNFITPVRILHNGRALQKGVPFNILMGGLFRRISSLAFYYSKEMDEDFKWLVKQSQDIELIESDLLWENFGGSFQGLTGKMRFEGDLTDFMPFIKLGELLHMGKGATYGMGQYFLS